MKDISVAGLDLAKTIFQVHGADKNGKAVGTKQLRRDDVIPFFRKLPICKVGMEACSGAHEWARQIQALGHEVKIIAPQYVKPYVRGGKTDARDAAGICEATARECVPSVPIKSRDSQQLQALHRMRSQWVKERTAMGNALRGLTAEFGKVMPKGMSSLRKQIRVWQEEIKEELGIFSELIDETLEHIEEIDKRIEAVEKKIDHAHQNNAACQLMASITGIGKMTATAIYAGFGKIEMFSSGRKFACALGLTPREHSSGGKEKRLGITKHGNGYIRRLLVQGAHSTLIAHINNPKYEHTWEVQLAKRIGKNKAVCALAAKNARRIWAIMQSGEVFRSDYAKSA